MDPTCPPPSPRPGLQYLTPMQLRVCELLMLAGGPEVTSAPAVQEEAQLREHLYQFALYHLGLHRLCREVVLFGCSGRSGSWQLCKLEGLAGPRSLIAEFAGVVVGRQLRQLRESCVILSRLRRTPQRQVGSG